MVKRLPKIIPLLFLVLFLLPLLPTRALGQEADQEAQGAWRARVVRILSDEYRQLPGLDIYTRVQVMEAEILEGHKKGRVITLENDFFPLAEGDKFFLSYFVTIRGETIYVMQEPDRRAAILVFIGLFVLIVLLFGQWQGLRSLIALAFSIGLLFWFLFPQLLAGAPPAIISAVFAVVVLAFAIYVTHGINRASTAALFGSAIAILGTIVLAKIAVTTAKISGFAQEESVYLHLGVGGQIDFQGLLLGAIIIGALGILDDIAITQAVSVQELNRAAPHLSRKEVYQKALRIGKEHVGALVNSLALAYVGAALPLLLLFYSVAPPLPVMINREVFATEIIRTIAGSIGIILAVPITTAIAALMLVRKDSSAKRQASDQEQVLLHHHHLGHGAE